MAGRRRTPHDVWRRRSAWRRPLRSQPTGRSMPVRRDHALWKGESLKACMALLSSLALAGCASQAAPEQPVRIDAVSAAPLMPIPLRLSPYTGLEIDQSRLPLASDVDVAWDEIAHRSNMRWDCRAVPSGKFVANSLCGAKQKIDSTWPGKTPPAEWSGVVFLD